MTRDRLMLNSEKTEIKLFGTPQQLKKVNITKINICEAAIHPVDIVKDILRLVRFFTHHNQGGHYNICSSNCGLLLAHPRIRSKKTLADRSSMLATPSLWNTLPAEICSRPIF